MIRLIMLLAVGAVFACEVNAMEFQVAVNGNDANPGTTAAPLRTIQRAAELAHAGDVILVHAGIYRERIDPPRGGDSDDRRIVYQAAAGENVEIRGSEPIRNWSRVGGDTWKVVLPNSFFGDFNPYRDTIHGDWFDPKGREHHTGAVYLNGQWLTEAAKREDVLKPQSDDALWFGQVGERDTTIWAQFKDVNPNREQVEINVRRTIFYPSRTGINYITVRGFTMRNAATPWAPPTAQQIGLIGSNWGRGWIIENNVISHSVCCGISLGKYGDEWDNKSGSAEGYVATIKRALENGWNGKTVGHHIVRNNTISHCGQAGIVGSLGAVFSTIAGNTIHDIHVRRLFTGAEMAGIKLHGAIDVTLSHNHIYRTCLGLWLDWMAQGTRVSGNLFEGNDADLFVEVDHGPFLVDNNLFLSPIALSDWSQGGAYVHNLLAGRIDVKPYDDRRTPYLKAHSTELAGMHDNPAGDDRFYNNLLVGPADLSAYDQARLAVFLDGNVYLGGAKPATREAHPVVEPKPDADLKLVEKPDGLQLHLNLQSGWAGERRRKLVTSELLGKASIPGVGYENPDGTPIRLDRDFFGKPRDDGNPTPGPFESLGSGPVVLKVW